MAPVLIDPKGDVTLEIVEYDEDAVDGAKERPVLRKQEFQVSRTVLIRDSRYFKTMFLPGHFTDSKKGSIALHDDTVASMELWLRALHKTELSYDQSLLEMWNIASASDKYHFELSLLIPWFKVWYKRYNIDTLYTNFKVDEKLNEKLGILDTRALLYPCWIFDHPQGFLRATEFLVYNCAGHVTEFNPTKHTKLHLESPVIRKCF